MNFLLSKYLFILILPFFGFCQHKAGIVDYGIKFNDTKYQEFLNNDKDQKKRVRFYMNEIFTNHKKVYSQDIVFIKLKFNQNEYRADPVDIMFPETVNQQMIMRNPTIYGNLKQNIYLEKFKKQGNVFLAELPNNFEWEITNEYKIIAGYKCRKAIIVVYRVLY
jgi:GLPGLI family protein